MYWLASVSTCTSSSWSVMPPGRMIFLVMTADGGKAMATFLVLVPLFLTRRRNGFGHFIELFDVAVGDPAALQRLDGTTLKHQIAGLVTAQLDQLDAGRTDVQTQHGRRLTTKQRPQ